MPKIPLTVYVDIEFYKELEDLRKKERMSLSAFLYKLLDIGLKEYKKRKK